MNNNHKLSTQQRVVVTGMGVVSSIGFGIDQFWTNLLHGVSGVTPISCFSEFAIHSHVGGEVKGFDATNWIDQDRVNNYGRASQLGIVATKMALMDAGLDLSVLKKKSVGIYLGTTIGECQIQEAMSESWIKNNKYYQKDIVRVADAMIAINIAREVVSYCHCLVIPTACAAGNYAIAYGYDQLRSGRVDIVIVGGSEAFSRSAFAGFNRMLTLSPDICRPFDKNRQGIIVGEGAGILVMETVAHAKTRGAKIHAEVLGYGLSCDAKHMTIPHSEGIALVIANAIHAAGLDPNSVDLICAHGTGTRMNDKTEYQAVKMILGDFETRVPMFSIKSMLGHTMGAASALEAIASVMAVEHGWIPPTINFATLDEECPVDCVPNFMRSTDARTIMNIALAFGANNAVTIFRKWKSS